jgi:hypothetical protein
MASGQLSRRGLEPIKLFVKESWSTGRIGLTLLNPRGVVRDPLLGGIALQGTVLVPTDPAPIILGDPLGVGVVLTINDVSQRMAVRAQQLLLLGATKTLNQSPELRTGRFSR